MAVGRIVRTAYRYKRPPRKPPEFHICPVCQVEFWLRSQEQRTCSRECSQLAKLPTGQIAEKMRS
jgi:hypothetical protein